MYIKQLDILGDRVISHIAHGRLAAIKGSLETDVEIRPTAIRSRK